MTNTNFSNRKSFFSMSRRWLLFAAPIWLPVVNGALSAGPKGDFVRTAVDPSEVKLEGSGLKNDTRTTKSTLEIIHDLREFKHSLQVVFDNTAYRLNEQGNYRAVSIIKNFANDYLSIFGWTKGITGLVKDFVMNYFGTADFHDNNGPLLGAIKEMINDSLTRTVYMPLFAVNMQKVAAIGKDLFDQEGGGMNYLFTDLDAMFSDGDIANAFGNTTNLHDQYVLKRIFMYATTDPRSVTVADGLSDMREKHAMNKNLDEL